jgi:signal transduction histidine kinase
MQSSSTAPIKVLAVGLAITAVALVAWFCRGWGDAGSMVPQHSYQLQAGHMDEWTAMGGNWKIDNGIVYNSSAERGAKLLAGSSRWKNYTLSADIRFTGDNADMGLSVRSNDEKEGVDTYNGYYVGLRTLDGAMVIGRSAFGYTEARPVHILGGVHPNVWYRMRVTAYGCNIAFSVQNLATLQTTWMAFTEHPCLEAGRIALRSLNSGGMWRNISVTGASLDDYLELERHATSVEKPEVPPGPPWWTPWHVGMIFGCTLSFALLTQLAYFRIQQWKAYTITQERQRLAHEIHDTMAQSFAGIGYQIQGIRTGVLRSEHLGHRQIADQLSVAYQLIRNCHEEASRTIAMLGSGSPLIQQDLLGILAKSAHKIAGDQITIHAEVHGSSTPLNLRLADALVHIGREAIANAVSHGNPSVLTISLTYEGRTIQLLVEDNGAGFDYTPESAGFGILGMQKRAGDVAGTLQISSVPGRGTQVRVTAKLQRARLQTRVFASLKEMFQGTPADG